MERGLRNLGLSIAAFAISLLVGEVGLRVAGISYPVFHQQDPVVGAWHRAGVRGWYIREGRAWVEINTAGMRDREHSRVKPPATYRIGVLGDSYTEAFQVDASAAFWSVAERELASCAALDGRRPQLLNFGVSGFGTAQQIETLRHRARDYDLDFVFLAFVLNDVRNNSRALERDPARPYYQLRDGALVLDVRFKDHPLVLERDDPLRRYWRRLTDHSYLAQLVGEVRNVARRRGIARIQGTGPSRVYAEPASDEWRDAWRVTEALLPKLRDEAVASGATFLLGILSTPNQVHPSAEFRREFMARAHSEDLFYPNERLERLAARERIPVLDLARPLLAHAERTTTCLHGFENAVPCGGHWNEHGHRIAGELLADEICRSLGS